jgi:hypothetical protein
MINTSKILRLNYGNDDDDNNNNKKMKSNNLQASGLHKFGTHSLQTYKKSISINLLR